MFNNMFDPDWLQFISKASIVDIMKMFIRFNKFGLSQKDIEDAIKSACDFFNIPMPAMIHDLTNVENGQTMFINYNPRSYDDDVLCFNMQQLVDMKVDSKEAFQGGPTHPEGALRALFIRHGKYKAIEMRNRRIPLTIQNLLNAFMAFRQQNLNEIYRYQSKYYRF